jgi:hypothetical protein
MATGGGLLDLVARGKKDTFFTQNPKVSFIHSVYPRSPAFTQEIRYTQPRNNAEWGRWVDFEIEPVGDIMRNPTLLIELPTWLPPAQAALNRTSYTTDISGVEYGYCQDVGALMIEKVQFYNDQLLLHEFWGQWLEWRTAMQENSSIYGALGGRHTTGVSRIGKAATPNRLRVSLPLLGNQYPDDRGFPIVALSNQRFRIRIYLRKLENVIEASDGRLNPAPWDRDFIQKSTSKGRAQPFRTLPKAKIGGPIITLETTQIYIPRDAQEYLRHTVIPLPFIQVQLVPYTIEEKKWFPIVNTGATVSIPIHLDFVGAMSRLTVGVQSDAVIQAGQLYQTNPPAGGADAYIQTIRLNMGLKDRLNTWPVKVWRDVANYYKNSKEGRDPNGGVFNVYTLTFGTADTGKPMGTINMSRVDTSVLYVDLAAIAADPRTGGRKSYVYVYGEAWNIFEIKNGKGLVLFAD